MNSSTNESAIKTGLLSFGLSGRIFQAPFVNQHPHFKLNCVCERGKKRAHLQYSNIKSYDSVDELINDPNLELVIVNTPNQTHFEFAMQALGCNKHVLIEKPFAITTEQAKLLFEQAQKHHKHVFAYHNRRFDGDYLSVKNIIESGKLGQLIEAHFRFDRYKTAINEVNHKEIPGPGSGWLYDLGSHLLDQVISLFAAPTDYRISLGYFRPATKVCDYAHVHLSYPKNFNVFVTTNMLVSDVQPGFIINGTKGSYVKKRINTQEHQLLAGMYVDDPAYGIEQAGNEGILTTVNDHGEKNQQSIASPKSSYLNLFEEVYQSIRHGKCYPITQAQILSQLEILESQPNQSL